jgi:hypothetical protein
MLSYPEMPTLASEDGFFPLGEFFQHWRQPQEKTTTGGFVGSSVASGPVPTAHLTSFHVLTLHSASIPSYGEGLEKGILQPCQIPRE